MISICRQRGITRFGRNGIRWEDMIRYLGGAFREVAFRLVAFFFLSDTLRKVIFGVNFSVEVAQAFDRGSCYNECEYIGINARGEIYLLRST